MSTRLASKNNIVALAALALVLLTNETMLLTSPFLLTGGPAFAGERRMEVVVETANTTNVDTTRNGNIINEKTKRHRPKLVLGPDFLRRLAGARETGKNALLIFENLHRISDQHVAVLAEHLKLDWDVEVVVAYRHLYDWLPSKYNQMNRPSKNKLNAAEWPGEINRPTEGQDILPFDLDNRGDFTALVEDIMSTGLHPTATVVQKYQPFFTTHVVDLHNLQKVSDAGDAYLQHLFCNILQAVHTCEAVASGQIGTDVTIQSNPSPSLHYEMLDVRAYQKGLILHHDSTAIGPPVSRHAVVLAIQRRQEIQFNLTANDFQLTCLSDSTLDRLVDLSVHVEATLFGYSVERDVQHRAGFAARLHAQKYCHIDLDRVLENAGWRNMLFSLGHSRRGRSNRTRAFGILSLIA